METKKLLMDQIKRENEYLAEQEVGTETYNDSLKRLNTLEDKLIELEKFEAESARKDKQMKDEKKDRKIGIVIDVSKFVVGTVAIPIIGLVCITATEKDTTFTGALREYTRYFLPKKTN